MSKTARLFRSLVLLAVAACSTDHSDPAAAAPPSGAPPPSATPAPKSTPGIVACFYDEARAAGVAVLEEGGSASDAFVAVTLVDYVRAAGETSLGGPLGALTYEAKSGRVRSLDATFDSVHDPAGLYDPAAPQLGKAVLVPGALRGLEAIWKEKGRLPWARLVEPARRLATDGYAADTILVGQITSRREVLERSAYAKALYLPDGRPLEVGAIVKQPEVASFLDEVAARGSCAMYDAGGWAESFVTQVNEQGGRAAATDLSSYEAKWQEPWMLEVRGKKVYANSGRAYGGLYGLIGLSVLVRDDRPQENLSDAERLEEQLRTARAIYDDPWFFQAAALDDASLVNARVADTSEIWAKVSARLPAQPRPRKGSHSLHVTIVDRDGDAITGTNTMNALPWGSGIFVRGVALTDAGQTTDFVTGPGQRVVIPLTLHVVTAGNTLQFVGGTFGSSLLETELQALADTTLGTAPTAALLTTRPRFGTFLYDDKGPDLTKNWLDDRAPDALVRELEERGLGLSRDPYGDTGWGTFVIREASGALVGGSLDESWFRGGVQELASRP
jgi:gamma-glutamyltranspeptidase/glutathione hydrolase